MAVKKVGTLCLLLLILLMGSGCSSSAPASGAETEDELVRYTGTLTDFFDTTISIIAFCRSEEDFDCLFSYAEGEYLRYHRLFDLYHTYPGLNNIKTVNDRAGISPVQTEPELIDLLEYARELYTVTDGRMNIALGAVTSLWHDAREVSNLLPELAYIPPQEVLEAAAEHCRIDQLRIDSSRNTVYLADPEMRLDLGAVAKGYATEQIALGLQKMGFHNFAINAGGNIKAVGSRGGRDWVAAITNPVRTSEEPYVGKVSVQDRSVVTSGSYQRFFSFDGKLYHHIIDPETLYPENRFRSVTVITEDSGFADACSTALFTMDRESGMTFAADNGIDVMWVLEDGSLFFTDGFHAVWSED